MKRWIFVFVAAIVFVLLLRGFLFSPYSIPSKGMENILHPGDKILVNKWSYGLRTPLMSLFSYHRWGSAEPRRGDLVVFNNPVSDEPVIDKREVYISRCVGIPGDTLLVDTLFNAITGWARTGPDRKSLYAYPRTRAQELDSLLTNLSIGENYLMGATNDELIRSFTNYEYYLLEQASGEDNWIVPLDLRQSDFLHQLIVPGAGTTITFNNPNRILYINTIALHEKKNVVTRGDTLFIDGMPADSYTFTHDYYWMMANNPINMADSRLFGFVPRDHLIGRASFIWFSKQPETGLFGGFRWKRMMRTVK